MASEAQRLIACIDFLKERKPGAVHGKDSDIICSRIAGVEVAILAAEHQAALRIEIDPNAAAAGKVTTGFAESAIRSPAKRNYFVISGPIRHCKDRPRRGRGLGASR